MQQDSVPVKDSEMAFGLSNITISSLLLIRRVRSKVFPLKPREETNKINHYRKKKGAIGARLYTKYIITECVI